MVVADLKGPQQPLVDILTGMDVVIACMPPFFLKDQIPLAEAAKKAGVGRFIPCNFANPAPRGVSFFIDQVRLLLNFHETSYCKQVLTIP